MPWSQTRSSPLLPEPARRAGKWLRAPEATAATSRLIPRGRLSVADDGEAEGHHRREQRRPHALQYDQFVRDHRSGQGLKRKPAQVGCLVLLQRRLTAPNSTFEEEIHSLVDSQAVIRGAVHRAQRN